MPAGQTCPQTPQFVESIVTSTQPGPHAVWPVAQVTIETAQIAVLPEVMHDEGLGHGLVHRPQFAVLREVSTHEPEQHDDGDGQHTGPVTVEQGTAPPPQPHTPGDVHINPAGQHSAPHDVVPATHVATHAPPAHI